MRFGVVLPTYPGGATIDGFVRVAQAAEELGFASAWTTDHVIMTPEESGPYAEIFEGITTLAYLAGLTRTVTLGISVIVVPQRNGVILAKELATLARFAPGRLVVGVGAGWNENEFRMLDAGDRFRRRGAYLDETIGLWRHLWAKPHEPFRTEFFNLPAVAFAPLPDEGPALPIWVGGSSPAALRRAGRLGDAWHPVGSSTDDIRRLTPAVYEAAEAAGRPHPLVAPRLAIEFDGADIHPALVGRFPGLRGDDQTVADRLQVYAEAGVDEVVCLFGTPDGKEAVRRMERFARGVMPLVGSTAAGRGGLTQ
ncbi:MAG: TIGR03619 family F420-dependent LLM class oxidoreductase [Chloroflexota bacterium]|nr:TIGR03619 family F420-dependent LLM class oxidoreductase [Chloroflexota bacterium]